MQETVSKGDRDLRDGWWLDPFLAVTMESHLASGVKYNFPGLFENLVMLVLLQVGDIFFHTFLQEV